MVETETLTARRRVSHTGVTRASVTTEAVTLSRAFRPVPVLTYSRSGCRTADTSGWASIGDIENHASCSTRARRYRHLVVIVASGGVSAWT